jgi:hypothetical protein
MRSHGPILNVRISQELMMDHHSMDRVRMHDAAQYEADASEAADRATAVPTKTAMTPPHLVIKRGHLGRYRFTLLTEDGRLSGQVKVQQSGASRAEQDALARAEVRQLAAALVSSTTVPSEYS